MALAYRRRNYATGEQATIDRDTASRLWDDGDFEEAEQLAVQNHRATSCGIDFQIDIFSIRPSADEVATAFVAAFMGDDDIALGQQIDELVAQQAEVDLAQSGACDWQWA